jgi:hypothetical protein
VTGARLGRDSLDDEVGDEGGAVLGGHDGDDDEGFSEAALEAGADRPGRFA